MSACTARKPPRADIDCLVLDQSVHPGLVKVSATQIGRQTPRIFLDETMVAKWLLPLLAVPAAALAGPLLARRVLRASPIVAKAAAERFEVCQNKYCRKKGAPRCLHLIPHNACPPASLPCQNHGHSGAHLLARLNLQAPSCAGAASTLRYFQELSEGLGGVEVVVADMGHTEHGCFDECTMGPNVRLDGEPQTDNGNVVNGVKGAAAVAELLGVDVPEGYK